MVVFVILINAVVYIWWLFYYYYIFNRAFIDNKWRMWYIVYHIFVTSARRYCDTSCLLVSVFMCVCVDMCWGRISRKWLEIEARFQWTTDWKWHGESIGHVTDDVTWPWKVKVLTLICLRPNTSKTARDRDSEHHRKWHMANQMVTWLMTSRDPLPADGVARAWRRFRSLTAWSSSYCNNSVDS